MNRICAWIAACGLVLLSGCNTARQAPAAGMAPASPADAELAQRIDSYFAPLAATSDISGTLRVERGGAPVLVRHFGHADWVRRKPHTEHTLYSAASVTKGITAATLVTLARDGTVSLDDPVGRWLPALGGYPGMTLRAVLRHRAGLPRDLPDTFVPPQSVEEWLAAHPEQVGAAGEESYSNVGYALLAEVIAAAAGAPLAQVAEQRVLRPAGMADSAIRIGTAGHFPGGALPYTAGPAPAGVMTPVPANLATGSSGLVTTAADLAKWARTLADGAYPELFAGDDPLGSIDVGSDGNGEYVAVQGSLPGYVANAIAWRGHDLTVSFAGNLFSYPALNLEDALRGLLGDDPPPAPKPRPAAVPLSAEHLRLAGEHRHPDFGPIRIAHDPARGGMVLTMPDRPAYWSFHLTPIADGAFHWRAFDRVLRLDGSGSLTSAKR